MNYLPLFLKVDKNQPVLVIGGGEIACAKTEALASVGAQVRIVAEKVSEPLRLLCVEKGFVFDELRFHESQLDSERTQAVVAATDNDVLNNRIARLCKARRILVNVVDSPSECDFIFPALVKRGSLQIAISSSGVSPVLARIIKQKIETLVPSRFATIIDFLAEKKSQIRNRLTTLQARRLFYEQVIETHISEEILEDNKEKADSSFEKLLLQTENKRSACLYLVGAGPGDPDLLTIKAVRVLGRADVVLHDRLVPSGIMEQYARKDAVKIGVGKARHRHYKTQAEINELIEKFLLEGKIVVRLKGGDPGIYAQGADEVAIAKRVGASFKIIPGISAANGCAAYAGIPLTERGVSRSLSYMTLFKDQLDDPKILEQLKAKRGETLALYMSSTNYASLSKTLIKLGYSAQTPLLVIEHGTTKNQKEYPATLETFSYLYGQKTFASPCLMIVGEVTRLYEKEVGESEIDPPKLYSGRIQKIGKPIVALPLKGEAYV